MLRVRSSLVPGAALLVAAATLAAGIASAGTTPTIRQRSHVDHVFVLMLENHSRASVIGDPATPSITALAHTYAEATDYYGVTHSSEPNYVAAISGSNWAVNNDLPTNRFDHTNLVDQLEQKHLTWAAYMESMPSPGFLGDAYPQASPLYANKHNPFVLFEDIRSTPARLAHIRPYAELAADLAGKQVPSVVWISPNLCHDLHGGVTATVAGEAVDGAPCPAAKREGDARDEALKRKADDFVHGAVSTIMRSAAWTKGRSAIFIVADETSESDNPLAAGYEDAAGCCDSPVLAPGTPLVDSHARPLGVLWPGGTFGGGSAPAVVVTTNGKRGYQSALPFNHYSLLATIEYNFGLGYLGAAADHVQVATMRDFLVP